MNVTKLAWDGFCLFSIAGIWPRYIEPKLLKVKHLELKAPVKSKIKIAAFSDLHWSEKTSKILLKKIIHQIEAFQPDIIVLLGDLICEGNLIDADGLKRFLNRLNAPQGAYVILGNHDYHSALGINEEGEYDVAKDKNFIKEALKRIFFTRRIQGKAHERVKKIPPHQALIELLKETPFKLLHNESVELKQFNLVGLGEYMADRALPQEAFKNYNKDLPGLILVHNPDMVPKLDSYPGDIILCGHTHGGEINLPWIWKRLTAMEHPRFKTGLIQEGGKWVYVTRGVGSTVPFRLNAPPELCLIKVSND